MLSIRITSPATPSVTMSAPLASARKDRLANVIPVPSFSVAWDGVVYPASASLISKAP